MYRRRLQIIILLILLFISFCSPQQYWKNWALLTILSFIFLVVGNFNFNSDYIFFNEGDFVYDPDYNHWNEINEPRDFQFETDFVTMKDSRKKVF